MNPESDTGAAITADEKEGEPIAITTDNDVPELKITKLIILPLAFSVIFGTLLVTLPVIVLLVLDDVSLVTALIIGFILYYIMRLVLPLNVYKQFKFAIQTVNMEHRLKVKLLVAFEMFFGYLLGAFFIFLLIDSNILEDYSIIAISILLISILFYRKVKQHYKKWHNRIENYPFLLYYKRDVDKLSLLLNSNNLFYREISLYALSEIKDKKSFDLINQKLINSQSNSKDDIVNRNHIYHSLRNLEDERVVPVLEKAFEKELENDEIKLAVSAAKNLSKLGNEAALEKIEKIKEETTDNAKKWEIEKGLEMFMDKDLVDLFNSLLKNKKLKSHIERVVKRED